MIPDFLAPGIVIRAPDKTSARESGDEATFDTRLYTKVYLQLFEMHIKGIDYHLCNFNYQ